MLCQGHWTLLRALVSHTMLVVGNLLPEKRTSAFLDFHPWVLGPLRDVICDHGGRSNEDRVYKAGNIRKRILM